MRVLVTGATGQVGRAVVEALLERPDVSVAVGLRQGSDPPAEWADRVERVEFDFADGDRQSAAFAGADAVFFYGPGQFGGDDAATFGRAADAGVRHAVLLSVEGGEGNPLLPHAHAERALRDSFLAWTMLRPAWFMQNYLGPLHEDLLRGEIAVPAGSARFTIVDVQDVGASAAAVLGRPDRHGGEAHTLTAAEALTFGDMADVLTAGLGEPVAYTAPSIPRFWRMKRRQGADPTLIAVMTMLHALPRVTAQREPTDAIAKLTGHPPTGFEQFVSNFADELR